jgi:hypothetical protein
LSPAELAGIIPAFQPEPASTYKFFENDLANWLHRLRKKYSPGLIFLLNSYWILFPALLPGHEWRCQAVKHFKIGDLVVYRKQKQSVHPGPHARGICPAPLGDDYYYYVDKFWTVASEQSGQTIIVLTRRGKQHMLAADDPALRPATWWERTWHRCRFPTLRTAN